MLQQQLTAAANQHQKEVKELRKTVKRAEQSHIQNTVLQQQQQQPRDAATQQVDPAEPHRRHSGQLLGQWSCHSATDLQGN